MTSPNARPSAQIIQFTPRSGSQNRFTTADRLELLRWAAERTDGVRCAIYDRSPQDAPDVGEFASVYPPDAPWAAWGAVRQGRAIAVWRSGDGRDIGRFETMGEALAAVSSSDRKRRCR